MMTSCNAGRCHEISSCPRDPNCLDSAAQAFVLTTQGAILRRATRAQPLTPPWQILKKGWGDNWKRIGQMSRRPGSQDLELAFVNASASESPITAGLKAVRQLVPGKKD